MRSPFSFRIGRRSEGASTTATINETEYLRENHDFKLILAYHTQGKEIYWQFQNYATQRARTIGEQFSNVSGYRLADVPFNSSFAGYKDWFILNYNRPGFTIEVGLGENPIPISQFASIYRENLGILITGLIQ